MTFLILYAVFVAGLVAGVAVALSRVSVPEFNPPPDGNVPVRVCGRLSNGGGIGAAGVTVVEMERLTAGGTGR